MESKSVKNRTMETGPDGSRGFRGAGGPVPAALATASSPVGPSSNPGPSLDCREWEGAGQVLFQSANLCFVAAFLVPRKSKMSGIVLRATLTLGFLLSALWAGAEVCAPDILAWNLTFLVTNCAQALYLAYKNIPPKIEPELQDLYLRVFLPLKVKKKRFRELVRDARVMTLEEDDHYAIEGVTPADQRLAVLISGRVRATCENVLLHYIRPHEFLDSPEFEACSLGSHKLFQVTLTAEETCRYLCWSRGRLEAVLKGNRCLEALFRNLAGKDITHKLYSLNEVHRLQELHHHRQQDSDSEWWRSQIPRSLSVDAVHTGARGRVRSVLWRRDRRTSGSVSPAHSSSGSPGYAAATRHQNLSTGCCHSHGSDPGPIRGPRFRAQPLPPSLRIAAKSQTGYVPVASGSAVPVATGNLIPVYVSTGTRNGSSVTGSQDSSSVYEEPTAKVTMTQHSVHFTFETSV